MSSVEEQIKAKAIELGYDACGIVGAGDFPEHEAGLEERRRLFPHAIPFYEQIKGMTGQADGGGRKGSVIVCLWRYDRFAVPERLSRYIGKIHLVGGYHYAGTMASNFQRFLQELGLEPKPGMAPARWAAVKAGLGKFRNNNFVYTENGSWNAIHTWVVEPRLDREKPVESTRFACPEGCNRCVKACPTGALSAPMTMDPTRCTAFLTFYQRSGLADKFRREMGTWIYGCDACQNACPANAGTWRETRPLPDPKMERLLVPEALLTMDETAYRAEIQPQFQYIGEDGLWLWRRNAVRAMANEDGSKYEPLIAAALHDTDPNVRETAAWAMKTSPRQQE